jgi:hypothetical protein
VVSNHCKEALIASPIFLTCPSAEQNSISRSSSSSEVVKCERSSKKYLFGTLCIDRKFLNKSSRLKTDGMPLGKGESEKITTKI